MAFKGTERRSATDIAEEIEAVGGELNAATSLETTAYFARILKADVGLALDILADILQIPRYAQDELEREREVILQEIAAMTSGNFAGCAVASATCGMCWDWEVIVLRAATTAQALWGSSR